MSRIHIPTVIVAAALIGAAVSSAQPRTETPPDPAPSSTTPKLPEQFRKPVALAWVEPGRRVAVANSRSGSISLVDVVRRQVVGETKIGARLTDLAAAGDSNLFAALDDKTHELLLLKCKQSEVEIIGRLRISDDPRRVVIAGDCRTAVVACRWSRRVDVVELRPDELSRDPADWNRAFPRLLRSIELPFAPQELAFTTVQAPGYLSDGPLQVVVADAFGGRLAVVDVDEGTIVAQRNLDGRNIRGLSLDDERRSMLVAYQRADGRQSTTAENLRAGKLAANLVALIPLDKLNSGAKHESLLDVEENLMRLDVDAEHGTPLGAADPDDVFPIIEGATVVLISGTNQLAVFGFGSTTVSRVDVGSRPTALLLDPTTRRMIVANSLDDTLSILEQTPATISLGPRPELWPRDRGERLFFDGRRSLGGFMSCHSCHTDGHTSGDLADTLGDNTYGTPKRIPTLLGISLTDVWGWNGELRELRDQVERSFQTSMHSPKHVTRDTDDVTAYLHTLPFVPPLHRQPADDADAQLVAAGRAVFDAQRCAECHVPPLTFTSPAVYDVGLRDERGLAKFNPPSLRGVGQGTSFFHDGRRKSLAELFRLERHSLDAELSDAELRALVRYLQGL